MKRLLTDSWERRGHVIHHFVSLRLLSWWDSPPLIAPDHCERKMVFVLVIARRRGGRIFLRIITRVRRARSASRRKVFNRRQCRNFRLLNSCFFSRSRSKKRSRLSQKFRLALRRIFNNVSNFVFYRLFAVGRVGSGEQIFIGGGIRFRDAG